MPSPAPGTTLPTLSPTTTPAATATSSPTTTGPLQTVTLAQIAAGFEQPTYLTSLGSTAPGGFSRLLVVEQRGTARLVQEGAPQEPPFLDIRDRVGAGSFEQGLLSLAFHPDYANNGYVFANYTAQNGDTTISRFQVSDDPERADPATERLLLTIAQPYANHNGGQLQFGPDGYLYIGMGDGGSGGDPDNNGQDPTTLLGSLLRIDVNPLDDSTPYDIPTGNPFAGSADGRDEIWAIGLRNPWRFSFDRESGDLYIADVGQNQFEEINYASALHPGGLNYGWNIMEGMHCFAVQDCSTSGLTLPVIEYAQGDGSCSVTGGYVYRGEQFPALQGYYFYGDFCSGKIWAARPVEWVSTQVFSGAGQITSFGEDAAGELYVVTRSGEIYQIQP